MQCERALESSRQAPHQHHFGHVVLLLLLLLLGCVCLCMHQVLARPLVRRFPHQLTKRWTW